MKDRPLSDYNAEPVLDRLEKMIEAGYSRRISDVYDDLSIFDWWPERLTITHMKQMRTFLKAAIKLGYKGYVCFKVGAHMCANGMWASKAESTNGYSPKGETIYRSFTPDYTYYAACDKNDVWYPKSDENGRGYAACKTVKQLEELIATI